MQRPEMAFLVTALVLGIFSSILQPPAQVPDENAHMARVLQISQGGVWPRLGDARTTGPLALRRYVQHLVERKHRVRSDFVAGEEIDRPYQLSEVFAEGPPLSDVGSGETFFVWSARVYPPWAYPGQVVAVWIAEIVSDRGALMFHAGRLGGLLAAGSWPRRW